MSPLPSDAVSADSSGHLQREGVSAVVVRSAVEIPAGAWERMIGVGWKGQSFHHLVEEAVEGGFEPHYLLLVDAGGEGLALQPFLSRKQDLLEGLPAGARVVAAAVRRWWPSFLMTRMLMVGSAAGEGVAGFAPELLLAVEEGIARYATEHGCSMVTWKDFPATERVALRDLCERGYVRIPSFPAVSLELEGRTFEEHMQTQLARITRKGLRRKFKEAGALQMEVVRELDSALAEEAHRLYAQVLARSEHRFEILTPEFLRRFGDAVEGARFFLWRDEARRLVAMSICVVHEGTLYDNYLGMDYAVALERHLYFVTLRDVVDWAVAHGLRRYYSTPLGYEPKLQLRFKLEELDLYVRHLSPLLNFFMKRIVPFLEPTRNDPVLKKWRAKHVQNP